MKGARDDGVMKDPEVSYYCILSSVFPCFSMYGVLICPYYTVVERESRGIPLMLLRECQINRKHAC